MTEEQKEILIAKMLDAPSSLSDEELDLMMRDDELREIYEASASLSSAYIPQPELDMKAEWERFRPRLRRKPAPMRWVMRVAAIFLGVIFFSGIAVRIIDKVFSDGQPPVIAKVEPSSKLKVSPVNPDNQMTAEIKEEPEKDPAIVRKHSARRKQQGAKAEINDAQSKDSEVDTYIDDIDIDEYLRIQQARIDNDLAMQTAEIYQEQYANLVALLDAVGVHDPELENMIIRVTPQ